MTGVEFCNFMHLPRRLPAARRQIYAFEHFVIVKIIADCGGVLIINPVKLSDFTDADAFMNAFSSISNEEILDDMKLTLGSFIESRYRLTAETSGGIPKKITLPQSSGGTSSAFL